jgi:flagellar M-ring protein FliF
VSNWASEFIGRLKDGWGRLTGGQRWLIAGLGASLALAVGVGYYLNRPVWVVLVSNADPKDAAAIVARLQELKVPYRPTGDGYTITVPQAEQYTAKLALAEAGLPKGTGVGMEIFDEPKFGATDFDQRVNFLRAQQGELERALLRIDAIEYANVKLAIPDKTVFTRDQQPVTAAVMVQPRAGHSLTSDTVLGIVNFVANAVQGLSTDNVKVVDQTGRLLSSGLNLQAGLDLGTGTDADYAQRQAAMQQDIEHRVQTMLEPIFGSGNVVARVSLELNLDASRIENQSVGNATPKTTATTRETTSGAPAGSQAGTGAADPGAAPVYQGQGGTTVTTGDQWRTQTTTTYEVSQRKEVTLVSPGAVKRISVGIAINRTDLTADQIKQIQDTVAGATGAVASAISVTAMPFSKEQTTVPVGTAATAGFRTTPLAVGLAAAVALLLAGFFLSRRRRYQPAGPEASMLAGAPQTASGSTLDVALGLAERPMDPAEADGQPINSASDAPEANQVLETEDGAENQAARDRLKLVMKSRPRRQLTIDGEPLDPDLLEHADELIETSPEACAEILRQWLRKGA